MNGWLWSGLPFWHWMATVVGQTLVGFVVIAVVLTPLWGRAKAFYKRQTDPTTPGGAGSRVVAGREVHEILHDVEQTHPARKRAG